jgi:hypothetical protein
VAAAILVSVLLAACGQALQLTSPLVPPARSGAAMAFDPLSRLVMLFGGIGGPPYGRLADTWSWNGSAWTRLHPVPSPPARSGAAIASDFTGGGLVLFGGAADGRLLDDTWSWDGRGWHPVATAVHPPALAYASMSWDPATASAVLFGGETGGRAPGFSDQTWIWNAGGWHEAHPPTSPPARAHAALAYDPARGVLVLFGGSNGRPLGDTWTWDGVTWAPTPGGPGPRYDAAAATDPLGGVVLFGGYGPSGSFLGGTWVWQGSWRRLRPRTSPCPRAGAAMAEDPGLGKAVLFGAVVTKASRGTGGTWEFDGTDWHRA